MKASFSSRSDILLAMFVLAIASMLLVPLPTHLLDILLACNISAALLLLLVGLYIPDVLGLLAFPALLLLSTLFRLGLNVASTRLILSQGDAGTIIEAFGSFLIKGEIVVGVIIFTIITIVNFIVIARGSSRVSEVAARFALDALPGKQMAIDADMRAGIITSQEAKQKRDDLRKESQLYGAMDGAMKFIQGDAIAGFFIIFTNILGGLYLGIKNGMGFSEAMETYSMLTVGDGLVSQVPALLISICAGIVVTRVSSGKNSTLGSDVGTQVFGKPSLVLLTAFVVLFLSLLPNIPSFPFIVVSLGLCVISYFTWKKGEGLLSPMGAAVSSSPYQIASSDSLLVGMEPFLITDNSLTCFVGGDYIISLYENDREAFESWWLNCARDSYYNNGIPLPNFSFRRKATLEEGAFEVYINASQIYYGKVVPRSLFVNVHPDSVGVFGLDLRMSAPDPITGAHVAWVAENENSRELVRSGSLSALNPVEYIAMCAASALRKNLDHALPMTYVHNLVKQLESSYPGLIEEAFDREFLSIARLTEVCRELLRQHVSIKDFRGLVEALASYCSTEGSESLSSGEFVIDDVVRFIRVQKKKTITDSLQVKKGVLKILTISDEVEEVFESIAKPNKRQALSVRGDHFVSLQQGLRDAIEPVKKAGVVPCVFVCSEELYPKVRQFLNDVDCDWPLISYFQLDRGVLLEPAGVWELSS